MLDLKNGRLDLGEANEVDEEASREVGDTDSLGEAGRVDVFHALPGQVDGVVRRSNNSVSIIPLGRVFREQRVSTAPDLSAEARNLQRTAGSTSVGQTNGSERLGRGRGTL